MTVLSRSNPLAQISSFAFATLCLFALSMQAQAYRIGENAAAVPSTQSYSTSNTASSTKAIASLSNLSATLSINSTTYSSGVFFGCGGLFQPTCDPYLQLASNDVLGARESGGTNNATSSMFTPNLPINNTRTASASNMGAWRVIHNVRNCSVSSSNECTGLGNITLTFSRPVVNPVIHLSEVGGLVGTEGSPSTTLNARLTIDQVNGGAASAASLTLVNSNSNLTVVGGNKIQTSNVAAGTSISCSSGGSNAGCGSVRINGTITSIRFASSLYINRINGGTPASDAGDGYSINVTVDEDFGDAPASYDNDGTNGAASHVVGNLYLGGSVAADNLNVLNYSSPVITASPNANGADADDNGATFPAINGLVVAGVYTASTTISAHTATARVCGWIDFNNNGTFDNATERACADSPTNNASSNVNLVWTVPVGASLTTGIRQSRVRVSYDTTNVQNPTGRLDSGEVEDYKVTINSALSNPPLNCTSNMYALLGDVTNGFRSVRAITTSGTTSGAVAATVASGATNINAALALSADGTKIFVPTDYETLWVYDVASGAQVSNNAFATQDAAVRMLRATVTNNNVGYFGADDKLYQFSTSAPYTVTGPVTMNVINTDAYGTLSPTPSVSGSGDFFADSSGNLFLSVNPTNQTFIDTFRIASNGNTLFLGRITNGVTADTYGGYAALSTGVYASAVSGRLVSVSFDDFSATQVANSSTISNSDLASCFYPNLTPTAVATKTATKVAGSAGAVIRAGDTLEYNIVIRNTGTLAAAGTTFQDTIPAGTTYVPNSTFYNYNGAGTLQALADVSGAMPFAVERKIASPGQGAGVLLVDKTTGSAVTDRDKEVIIQFRVIVNASATNVQNQGVMKYIDDPGPPTYITVVTDDPTTPAPNDATTSAIENADLVISKTDGVTSVTAGGSTTYTMVVTNNGPFAVTNPVIKDAAVVGIVQKTLTCTASTNATCPTAGNLTVANLKAGLAIPSIPVGESVTFTLTADISKTSGTVDNVATITSTIGDPDLSNNTATDSNTVTAPTAITATTAPKEARFTAVPNIPTIVRGSTGNQLVTITNNGPDSATNAIATFTPVTQTGVSVTGVSVVGGGACTFASPTWTCPTIPTVANGGTFQLNVTYATTAASSLGQAPQAEIRVKSDEYNPGSGVGESLYKSWGSNQTNEIRPNGAFWVGYQGTGGSAQVGSFSDENTAIISAWPANQASPTGAYLVTANPNRTTSVYGPSSTTAQPITSRIITNLSTDPDRTITLPQLSTEYSGDNRRAWEYKTGVYVPTAQNVTLCVGNTSVGIDDNAYIMLDGNVVGTQDNYVAGGYVTASVALTAGYHSLNYRIVNQNTYAVSGEGGAGAYGAIGILYNGACNTAGFDAWVSTAVPASIIIIEDADLAITKTDGITAMKAGNDTTYVITATNNGPLAVSNAVITDPAVTGITKKTLSCTATNGAQCPTAGNLTIANLEAGLTIPSMPSGSTITLSLLATINAAGSITNTATISSALNDPNTANNTASDTNTVTLNALASPPAQCVAMLPNLVGNATQVGGQVIQLTQDTNSQIGAAWSAYRADLTQSFDFSTYVNVGNRDGDGADGVTFMFHNSAQGLSALGATGRGIGAGFGDSGTGQITPSFVIEFDTFQNNDGLTADPTEDHTAMYFDGDVSHFANGNRITPATVVGNIEDGQWREVRVVWQPSTKTLTYYFGGVQIYSGTVDLVTRLGTSTVYWGYTASTGGFTNLHQICNINLPPSPVRLKVTKTSNGPWSVGQSNANYTLGVSTQTGTTAPSTSSIATVVRDLLPAGITANWAGTLTTNGWSCTASGQNVTCTQSLSLAANGAAVSNIVLPVQVAASAAVASPVINYASVGGGGDSFNGGIAPTAGASCTDANRCANVSVVVRDSRLVSGRVFTDNSGTTAVAANAYNGTQEAGELGIAGTTVQLTNCASTVVATTTTDAAGDYLFDVTQAALPTPNFCVVEQNLTSYSSVSGTTGYNRTTDTITISNSNALSYTGHNFGDARLGVVLTSDGQQTTTPSGTVSYAHTLTTEAVLTPTLSTTVTQQPNNVPDQIWSNVLYLDSNCNGVVDGSEAPVGTLGVLLPNQTICVVQRVNAPASASNGAQHVASLSASYVATVQGGATVSGTSQTRTDTTLIGTAGLDMTKQVRVVASCPSTGADANSFTARNTAKNGDFLEYEIIYKNRSPRNLSEVVIRDAVPSHALFKTASCTSTPSGASCAVTSTPTVNSSGVLRWDVTGPVAGNQQGSVRFCVQIPALVEGPQ